MKTQHTTQFIMNQNYYYRQSIRKIAKIFTPEPECES